jgi:hypothetical protein
MVPARQAAFGYARFLVISHNSMFGLLSLFRCITLLNIHGGEDS